MFSRSVPAAAVVAGSAAAAGLESFSTARASR